MAKERGKTQRCGSSGTTEGKGEERRAASTTTVSGAKLTGCKTKKRKHYTGRPQGADETRRLEEARTELTKVRAKIRKFAEELVPQIYSEHGPEWGAKFRDIEILGDVIGMEVATRFTESSVSQQAETLPEEAGLCPCCGGAGERREEDELRSMTTLTGVVEWSEAEFTCPVCRRSFFPSEPRFGD